MLPANRAFNSNGLGVPGAVAKLYTTGTLTPQNFYADGALSTSLGPTITANGAGRFPNAYGDDSTPYRLRVEDAHGVELDDMDPFYFGTVLAVNLPNGATVATRTALAAVAGIANQSAILAESGREGTFVFSTADLSAEVAADTAQGIYVAPSSDTTGASGAWVRTTSDVVEAIKFGVSAISTDNYAALGNAIAVARLLKKTLLLPAGTLTINQTAPSFALQDDDRIIGAGKGKTTLYFTGLGSSGNVFTSTGKSRILIADLKMEASTLQTGSQVAVNILDGADCLVRDCIFNNWTNGVLFRSSTLLGPVPPQATNVRNKAVRCVSLNSRSYAFFMEFATACEFLYCEAYNVTNQDGFKTGGGTMFAKIIGCHAEGCNGDGFDTYDGFISSVMADCTSYNNASNGFQLKGTLGGSWSAGDYVTRDSVFSNLTAKGNALAGFLFQETRNNVVSGLVASTNGTSGIIINNCQGISFGSCEASRNTQHGWSLIGNTSRCAFAGCSAIDNSYVDGTVQNGTYDGFNLNTAQNCQFTGCFSTNGTITGRLGGQGYAINTTTSAGNFFNGCSAGTSVTGAVGGTTPYANNKFTAFDAAGTFIPSNQPVGYPSGFGIGGNVTQATSKTTGVTLNALTGYIIMQAGALAAGATAEFTVTNSLINQRDTIHLNLAAGAASGSAYQYWISGVATGSFKITLLNRSAGSLSEGVIFNFAVVKATNT
jgi:hypothetical protein